MVAGSRPGWQGSLCSLERQLSRERPTGLVNCDKPVGPFVKPPLMVHEALAPVRKPLQLDSLSITDGHIRTIAMLCSSAIRKPDSPGAELRSAAHRVRPAVKNGGTWARRISTFLQTSPTT